MPIVFHFKDRGEPPDTRLKPKERERMASPLILRPVRVGKQWHPAALVLRVPGATEVPTVLDQHDVRTVLHDDELDKIEPLARRNGADVLERFVDFFMESAPQAQGQGSRRNHR
jgi:CRISPR-associated protein Cmr1